MMDSLIRTRVAACLLGLAASPAWAEAPPLLYDISPSHVAIFDVTVQQQTLYAVGERGVLLTSATEAPDRWQSARLPSTQAVMGIAFGDQAQGVVVGHGGMILFTDDGGRRWQPVDVSEHSRNDPFMDVAHLGDSRFLAVGAFGLVMLSEDGGRHWQPLTISDDYFDRHLYSIVRAGNHWLLIGESGSLFSSADGGQSWQQLESPYQGSFFGGMETPEGAWLLYGMRGQVWRSGDRGASWQRVAVDSRSAFNAHGTGSNGDVYLFGNGGQVLVSTNDGRHFAPSSRSGLPGDITSASHINGKWLIGSTAGIRLWQGNGE